MLIKNFKVSKKEGNATWASAAVNNKTLFSPADPPSEWKAADVSTPFANKMALAVEVTGTDGTTFEFELETDRASVSGEITVKGTRQSLVIKVGY